MANRSHPYLKSSARSIRHNWTRFIFIALITLVGIAFITGLGGISDKVTDSLSENFIGKKAPDLILKYGDDDIPEDEAMNGFTEEDYLTLDEYSSTPAMQLFQMDFQLQDPDDAEKKNLETRIYGYPFQNEINKLEVVQGSLPDAKRTSISDVDEETFTWTMDCVIEEPVESSSMTKYKVGDSITIDLYDTFGKPVYDQMSDMDFSGLDLAKVISEQDFIKTLMPDAVDFMFPMLDTSEFETADVEQLKQALLNLDFNSLIEVYTKYGQEKMQALLSSFNETRFHTMFVFKLNIVGIVKNPLMFVHNSDFSQVTKDPETDEYVHLDRLIYTDFDDLSAGVDERFAIFNELEALFDAMGISGDSSSEETPEPITSNLLPITDIYMYLDSTLHPVNHSNYFTDSYHNSVKAVVDDIKTKSLSTTHLSYLTMKENMSFEVMNNIRQKINIIAGIFPLFFIAVVALVTLTTSTRMIDEERSMIACYKSLGYPNSLIIRKYLLFSGIASAVGAFVGIFIGAYTLPLIIYPAFGTGAFYMPPMTEKISLLVGIFSAIAIVVAALLATLLSALKTLKATPANMIRPKAPKPGKKILLERIGFIWKRMKFKYKSTFRNVFRYKDRLWMIVISTMGCTGLMFAGCALFDMSGELKSNMLGGVSLDMTSTIRPVAMAIIGFAGVLTVLVVFNLVNMNVGERQREIASLEVLGYYPREVNGYIYKEIFLMCMIGIALGIPAGIGFVALVFYLLEFGAIEQIHWYTYLISVGVSIVFVLLVRLFMMPKIAKIDMNDSLKSVE